MSIDKNFRTARTNVARRMEFMVRTAKESYTVKIAKKRIDDGTIKMKNIPNDWPVYLSEDIVRKLQRKEITREEFGRLANKQAMGIYNMIISNRKSK